MACCTAIDYNGGACLLPHVFLLHKDLQVLQLYLVRMSHAETGEVFYKLGVATDTAARFKFGSTRVADSNLPLNEQLSRLFRGEKYISDHPYEVEEINVVDFTFEGEARLRERDLLASVKPIQYWPKSKFSGHSECFQPIIAEDKIVKEIIRQMNVAASIAAAEEPSELDYTIAEYYIDTEDPIERHLQIMTKIKGKS